MSYLDRFSDYSDTEIINLVKDCFDSIEKTGEWKDSSIAHVAFLKIRNGEYYTVSNFLDDLYAAYAKRNNLYLSYRQYLKSTL